MGWFKRVKEGITTATKEKKETPEGLWNKCSECNEILPTEDHEANLFVCPKCGYHERIGSGDYFKLLFDNNHYEELFSSIKPADPLNFSDTRKYTDRLADSLIKTKFPDAITIATGMLNEQEIVIGAMNFNFIGGSMGSVVGEKIARSVDYCIAHAIPLIVISKSGGARMMEAAYSLMQMAKTAAKLTQLSKAGLPYISLLTDPTTGGVTASFAMLGDVNIAEPKALIGFAGPRVVKETIGKDLPAGFQTSEFVLEHGFIDMIVTRHEMKGKISGLLKMFKY